MIHGSRARSAHRKSGRERCEDTDFGCRAVIKSDALEFPLPWPLHGFVDGAGTDGVEAQAAELLCVITG